MNQQQAFRFLEWITAGKWEKHSSDRYWYRFDKDELPGNPWPPRPHNIKTEEELWEFYIQTKL